MKINATVKKETKYVALWVLILSALMEAVFLVLGKWDFTVLLGNLLGGGGAILNFLLMGLTVQKAVEKDEKDARSLLKLSQSYRLLLLAGIVILGILLPIFHTWAVIPCLVFPRISFLIRPVLDEKK